jgi:hypothetical protein
MEKTAPPTYYELVYAVFLCATNAPLAFSATKDIP